jgi:hypothetical protein
MPDLSDDVVILEPDWLECEDDGRVVKLRLTFDEGSSYLVPLSIVAARALSLDLALVADSAEGVAQEVDTLTPWAKNSFQNDRRPPGVSTKPAGIRSFEQSDPESSRMPLDAVGETLSLAGALSDAPK